MPVSYQMPSDRREWQHFVRAYLKAIMLLRGFTYQTLSEALSSKLGVEMHADQLRKLIHRGAFKAEFLLQCAMLCMHAHTHTHTHTPTHACIWHTRNNEKI